MEEKKFNLILGDCLVEMEKLIAIGTKVDMILCDLPYGTTACSWDAVIPIEPLWDCYKRIIKDNGAIVLFGTQPFSSTLISSNIKQFRYEIIWEKSNTTNFWFVKKQIAKRHENILVFYEKQPTYNPLKIKSEFKHSGKRDTRGEQKFDHHQGAMREDKHIWNDEGERYQGSVIRYSHDDEKYNSSNGEQNRHPTQKPVELMKFLIATYTNENELVLDNTMGSGTTGLACMKMNRKFIGIEKEQKYFDLAEKRIVAEENQIKLF